MTVEIHLEMKLNPIKTASNFCLGTAEAAMLWMLNFYYFNHQGISAKQIYSCRHDMQIKQLALVAHFLLALVIPSEYAR